MINSPNFSNGRPRKLQSNRAINTILRHVALIKRIIHEAIPRKQSKMIDNYYINIILIF